MSTTTSTAINTGLGDGVFGTFESTQQLNTLNDRDIFELMLNDPTASTGTVIAYTEVDSAFTALGLPLNIEAANRIFDDSGAILPLGSINASSGDPAITFAPADYSNTSLFVGVSTASSPLYNPNLSIIDPGANIIFNYSTSIVLLKNQWLASETILGTTGDDTLEGTDDAEALVGLAGDDFIQGGNGADEIDGGSGDDLLSGQVGADCIRGGEGNDTVFGGLGADIIDGDAGDDLLRGGLGGALISGGDGNDLISGEQGADTLNGGDGNDTVNGGLGDDEVNGDDGDDLLRGLEDNDVLNGGDGNDDLRGNDGEDTLNGDDGDDVLRGQGDDDEINGGAGNDTAFGGLGDDLIFGNAGDDFLRGGVGDDSLNGGNGDDLLSGELGDDFLRGGNGNDTLIGGLGSDTLRGYGNGSDSAEQDILISANDNVRDRFILGSGNEAFYDEGGDADFALLRGVEIDPDGVISGVEDRIQLATAGFAKSDIYFLSDVAFLSPSLGTVSGVGIYRQNGDSAEANDLIGVIENVFEASIVNGINNNLFVAG